MLVYLMFGWVGVVFSIIGMVISVPIAFWINSELNREV